jgi:Cof subfamily protein (haloacid dehalogenase superfamily)
MVELVTIDLDGTLLTSDKTVTTRSQRAIKALSSQGIRVVLASARPPRSMAESYKLLDLDTVVICYNGALIFDPPNKDILYHKPMDKLLARGIIELARETYPDTLASVEVLDNWYTDKVDPKYPTEVAKRFKPDQLGPMDTWLIQDVTKLLLLGPDDHLTKIRRRIYARYGKHVSMTQSDRHILQVMARHVSKGQGLKFVCQHYGVDLQKTLAIGDAANDTDMLKIAGIGIAMGNAPDAVRKAAHYVTSSNDEDGVAEALERFVL